MTNSTEHLEVSERLRDVIDAEFRGRGRFPQLEAASGINASKWRNFLYKKQSATSEMLEFACKRLPEKEIWIKTGQSELGNEDFALGLEPPPRREDDTVGTRLKWAIRESMTPRGDDLIRYLWETSGRRISVEEWTSFFVDDTEPTVKMIKVVCANRRMFSEWVMWGSVYQPFPDVGGQLDPSDPQAVKNWAAAEKSWHERFFRLRDADGASPSNGDAYTHQSGKGHHDDQAD